MAERDVTIRVSVQMSGGQVSPPDFSAVHSAIDTLREQIRGVVGGIQIPNIPIRFDSQSGIDELREQFRAVSNEAQTILSQAARVHETQPISIRTVTEQRIEEIQRVTPTAERTRDPDVSLQTPETLPPVQSAPTVAGRSRLDELEDEIRQLSESRREPRQGVSAFLGRTSQESAAETVDETVESVRELRQEFRAMTADAREAQSGATAHLQRFAQGVTPEMLQSLVDEVRQSLQIERSPVEIGQQGYNAAVEQRASNYANQVLDAMNLPHGDERTDAISQMIPEIIRQIRESDREERNTRRSQERTDLRTSQDEDSARGRRQTSAGNRAAIFAQMDRELEQEQLESDNRRRRAAQERHRQDAEQQQQVWRDAEQGVAEWSRAKRAATAQEREHAAEMQRAGIAGVQFAKGLAQLAISTSHLSQDSMQAIVAVEGFANLAQAAMMLPGPLKAAAIALSAVAAGGSYMVYRANRAHEISMGRYDMDAGNRRDEANLFSTRLTREHERREERVTRMPDTTRGDIASALTHQREQNFQNIQSIDADPKLSPEQKDRRRQAEENRYQFNAELTGSNIRQNRLREQLFESRQNRINPDKANAEIDKQFGVAMEKKLDQRHELATHLADIARAEQNPMGNMGFNHVYAAYQQDSGRKAQFETQMMQVDTDMERLELDKINAKKRVQEEIVQSKERELHLTQEMAREAGDEHKILQTNQRKAHEAVRREEEGIRAAEIGFGSRGAGDQMMIMNLEKKAERIAQQQALKDAGQNVTVEQLNEHDKSIAQMGRGKFAMTALNRQSREEAQKAGFESFDFNKETLAPAQADQKQADGMMAQFGPALKAAADKYSNTGKSLASEIVPALEKAFDLRSIGDEIMLRIKELERAVQFWKLQNFGSGRQ